MTAYKRKQIDSYLPLYTKLNFRWIKVIEHRRKLYERNTASTGTKIDN